MKERNDNQKKLLRSCIKAKDGWWATLFAGPVANRLLEPICNLKFLTPNHLTLFSLFIGCLAAYCFFKGDNSSLLLGAILVQLSFVVDCMDGQFARYSKKFSDFGAWLDRISDRVKDFLYFFSLAWGFYTQHSESFSYGCTPFVNFISNFIDKDQFFTINPNLHMITMQAKQVETWLVFPIAMIAMFAVFLIDYYVNQDMKFPTAKKTENKVKQVQQRNVFLRFFKIFLTFGLSVYRSVPILRFNIGEQALLISLFCACGAVFSLLSFFALLGSFYIIYWPFAKYFGFTEDK